MVVKSNMSALNTNRQLGVVTIGQQKSMEKLSSGYKINRAADDAAGLAISEKMRRQIRGLTQASNNAQDGVSFCQIADGALNEVHDMLKRSKTLAIQASNATYTDEDRAMIQEEVEALSNEIDRIHNTAVFNERMVFSDGGIIAPALLKGSSEFSKEMKFGDMPITIEFNFMDPDGNKVGSVAGSTPSGVAPAANSSDMGTFVVKTATDVISRMATIFPNLFSSAATDGVKVGLNCDTMDGKGGVLASAALGMSWSNVSSTLSYTMNVDIADYPPASFASMTDKQKADLASTVAHEMTHIVMYDTLTVNMSHGNVKSLPQWFIEGVAQTTGGPGGGWLEPSRLNGTSTDAEFRTYMGQLDSNPYGSGYLASLVLGQLTYEKSHGTVPASSATIAAGLDTLLTDMAKNGKSLDQAIKDNTSFAGYNDFTSSFKKGLSGTLPTARKILAARGMDGAGALIGNLNDKLDAVFNPTAIAGVTPGGKYQIMPDATKYSNAMGAGIIFPAGGSIGGGNGNNDSSFYLQIGAEQGQGMTVNQFNISADALFGGIRMNVSTVDMAQQTIDLVDEADARVSYIRAYYGATQNRLEHTIKNLDNVVENTTAAESGIRDTDMSEEMVKLSIQNIFQQAGVSMLAQANQQNSGILSLL